MVPSPSKIGEGNNLAALTLTLSHAGSGMGEGSLFSINFGRAQLMGTPAVIVDKYGAVLRDGAERRGPLSANGRNLSDIKPASARPEEPNPPRAGLLGQ